MTPDRIVRNTPVPLDIAPVNWHDHEMESMSVRVEWRSVGGGLYRFSASVLPLVGLLFLASATASLVTAQTNTARRTVWDGAYTEDQATRGATAFGQSCAGCHALGAVGRAPLSGEAFWKSFAQKSVGDLFDFVSTYMPNATPGSLSEDTYKDIVAVMLKSNGFPAGAAELARNTMADVQIIEKDGGTDLPANALARVFGCLTRSGADWVVTSATTPERAERAAAGGDDATRPLGNRTITLKFVLGRLDAMAGSRVVVNGILMTTVSRVTPKCP